MAGWRGENGTWGRQKGKSRWIVSLLALAALATAATALAGEEPVPAPAGDAGALDPTDPVRLRMRLLAELDAQIRADAARRHLEARLLLDRVLPIAYLGVDADADADGMRLTKVYPDTGAEAAGLRAGDLVRTVAGDVTDSAAALGRAIRRHHVGDHLEVTFLRGEEARTTDVVLTARVEEDEDEDEQYPELIRTGVRSSAPASFAFDGPTGSLPEGLLPRLGGHGAAPGYAVVKEAGTSFLRQTANDKTGIRFPMAVAKDTVLGDGAIRVRFRFQGGEQDRAAGVMLHWQDEMNYLVARANAVEEDLRIFRIVNGVRRTLPGARAMGISDDDAWHTLEVRAEGPRLTAIVDGRIQAVGYDTYLPAGRVGLWTKSDAVSDFDDFEIEPSEARPSGPR